MKKLCLVITAVCASVLAVNSSPLMAQTADVSAKTDQERAKEIAALRRQDAEIRERIRRLEQKGIASLPRNGLQKSAATSAMAADLPTKAAVATVAPAYNWTGFYIGGNVGGAWTRNDATRVLDAFFSTVANITGGTGGSTVLGGFQEGFNWQFARSWVFGLEADWSFTDASGGLSQAWTTRGFTIPNSLTSMSTRLEWLGSARNRLGYLIMPNLMLYGTGGVAWGKISYVAADALNNGLSFTTNTQFSHTSVGWTLGGGLEWMVGNNWLLRGEYLHYQLDSAQNVSTTVPVGNSGLVLCVPGPCPTQTTVSYSWAKMNIDAIRMALSYKF
jgi:outer membrane immunogenic protein